MYKRILSLVFVLTLLTSMSVLTLSAAQTGNDLTRAHLNTDDMVGVSADNSFGAMLGAAVSNGQSSVENSITDVTIEGDKIIVEFNQSAASIIVVGIYDETSDTLFDYFVEREIPADAQKLEIDIDIDMPQFFYLRAFILDSECCPLGKQYESSRYTKAYKDFLSMTTDDFAADRVVNLDQDKTDNFTVLGDNVERITTSDTVNTPSKSGNIYTFDNIDDSLRGLKSGDLFEYEVDGVPEVIKVGRANYSGDTLTVTAAKAEMEEVFDYVKIDYSSKNYNTHNVAPTGRDREDFDLAPTGVDVGFEYDVFKTYSMGDNDEAIHFGVSGSVTVGANVSFKLHYSASILETELVVECGGEINVELSAKLSHSFTLGVLPIPTPIAGVVFTIKVEVELEAEAQLQVTVPYTGKIGFAYNEKSGFTNLSQKPKLNYDGSCEGRLYAGVKLTPAVNVFLSTIELGIPAKIGLEAVGTREATVTDAKTSDHLCRWCISGSVSLVFSAEAELEFGVRILGLSQSLSFELGELSKKLFDYHYSSDTGYGKGVCTNRKAYEPTSGYQKPYYEMPPYGDFNLRVEASGGTYTAYITGSGLMDDIAMYDYIWQYNRAVEENADRLYPFDCGLTNDEIYEKRYEYIEKHHFPTGNSCSRFVVYISGFEAVRFDGVCRYYWADDPEVPIESVELHISSPCEYFDSFYLNEATTVLTLPDTLRHIAYSEVFVQETKLTHLRIPPQVEHIEPYAFAGSKLINIELPPTLKTIGHDAFRNSVSDKLVIPETVEYMDYNSLGSCRELTVLCDFPKDMLYDKTILKKVTFGENVTEIPYFMFEYSGLESVVIPGTVKRIGVNAFGSCENLREVIIGEGVKEIDFGAFYGCPLEHIYLPSSLSMVYMNAFLNPEYIDGDKAAKKIIIDYGGTVSEWYNIITYFERDELEYDRIIATYKMSDMWKDGSLNPFYAICTVYCYPDEDESPVPADGLAPTGWWMDNGMARGLYRDAEYLIAVEDKADGRLEGAVTVLMQVKADQNGCIDLTSVFCEESRFLNTYGACRHPSAHVVDDNYLCDVCGEQLLALIPAEALKEESLLGDVDGDGAVTIIDATAIQRHLASIPTLAYVEEVADTDLDGSITIIDATYIQRWLACLKTNDKIGKPIS